MNLQIQVSILYAICLNERETSFEKREKRDTDKCFTITSFKPQFRSFFRNLEPNKFLWHDYKGIKDDKLRDPMDSLAWKKVDEMWQKLGMIVEIFDLFAIKHNGLLSMVASSTPNLLMT